MIYGSVCSGIEAASVAWEPLGWKPSFFAEIEAFPRAVLAHRWPSVACHGDFTTIRAGDYEPIDLLVGGTPCQSFSVAGLRGGMGDDRGKLALEYLRLADRLRPKWLVWENVPGVLSSNGGRDFGSFLGGLVELGYGFAYRVLDAQFFGVAQRRRRVFVVGYAGDWRRAAAVLFERHSLQGHPAPRREAGERAAQTIAGGARRSGGYSEDDIPHVAHCLNAHGGGRQDAESETLLATTLRARDMARGVDSDCTDTLIPVAFDTTQITSAENRCNPQPGDPCHPLARGAHAPAVALTLRGREGGAMPEVGDGMVGSLRAASGGSSRDYIAGTVRSHTRPGSNDIGSIIHTNAVRRLTPRECERLQGFEDDYTLIPWRKGMAPDSPRYKALGNSMAVPVMRWIGERIEAVEALGVAAQDAA